MTRLEIPPCFETHVTGILLCASDFGGIGLRAKILSRESFSDFILAYVSLSGRRALAVAPLGDKIPFGWR